MKHRLKISVSKDPQTGGIVSCRNVTLREKLLRCLLGNIQKVRDGEPLGGRSSAADDFATDLDDDFLS